MKRIIAYAMIATLFGSLLALAPLFVMGSIRLHDQLAPATQNGGPYRFLLDYSSNENKALSDADLWILAISFVAAIVSYGVFKSSGRKEYRMIGPHPVEI